MSLSVEADQSPFDVVADEFDREKLSRRLSDVLERIDDAGSDPDRVRIVAVTKGFGSSAVLAASALGLDIGESYAQELVGKASEIASDQNADHRGSPLDVRWHFIGNLQSNKIKQLAPVVSLWQSIDRSSIVGELARRAPGASVLIEVNLTGEAHRGGCSTHELGNLISQGRDAGLDVCGLMVVAPRGADDEVRSCFRTLSVLADTHGLAERSMGMSGDFEMAVREGSTMVRLGTVLFGPRPNPRHATAEMRH